MSLLVMDLRGDAVAEALRLTSARAWSSAGDEDVRARHDGFGPLVARARRNATRRRLGGRALVIFRVICRDAAGRAIETDLVAALVAAPAAGGSRPRDRVRAWIGDAELAARPHVDAASARWADAAAATAGRFAAARAFRERAIAERTSQSATSAFQPGLFDRRAERAHWARAATEVERDQTLRARRHAADQSVVQARTTELLLVLTP